MSNFTAFCPCCQSYHTDDKHQNHCLLGHAERRIAELEQRLAAAETKIPRWVPVTEQLPETDDACLVLQIDSNGMHGGPLVAYFEAGSWWSRYGDVEGVTLWMLIPEAML